MLEYDVKFIFDYCYIGIVVIGDTEDYAIRAAEAILADTGIDYPEAKEVYVEQTGEFLNV